MNKCPSCGTPEKARVKVCTSCGEAFASEDLLELNQLEFLLETTAEWDIPESIRHPYLERLKSLRDRLVHREPVPVVEAVPVVVEAAPPEITIAPAQAKATVAPVKVKKAPPKEKVPFDQWLLSERNIKIALYTGGLLLVLAGIIFIGVNWTRIPGPGKFAITLLVTGLMYLGGYLLFQREAFRIGGVALLGIASGFLTLNFAVLQIYVLADRGLQNDVMWLIASPLCLLLYTLTAHWTRSQLFSYISIGALISTLTASLVVANAPEAIFIGAFSIFFFALLLSAGMFQKTKFKELAYQPLLIVAHAGMPLVMLTSIIYMFDSATCQTAWLFTSVVGLLFYLLAAYWSQLSTLTYVCIAALVNTLTAILVVTNASETIYFVTFSIFFFGLLLSARGLQRTKYKDFTVQPLTIAAHAGMPLVLLISIRFMVNSAAYQTAWLFTSVVGLVFYLLAAYWSESSTLTYINIAALINTLTAVLVVTNASETIYFVTFSILFFGLFLAARGLQKTRLKEFTVQPLSTAAHAGMPLVLLISILLMVNSAAYQTSWLFTSLVGLMFYLLGAYWARSSLLTYISLGAGINLITAILAGLDAPGMVYILVYGILMVAFLGLGVLVQKTPYAEFTQNPLQMVSNIGMPIALVSSLVTWLVVDLGLTFSASSTEWLVIITFGFGVLFYVLCDVFYGWLVTRWAAAFLFALTFSFTLVALDFSDTASGISLMILSLVYLGIGYLLEQKEGKAAGGWPLYGMAYLIAGFVTLLTFPEVDDLILVLVGDAIILGLSAAIHREYNWVYGAAWLFMLPVYLTINLYGPKDHFQGLLLGVLCLNYLVVGYLLGRRELRLGGPFLTAAAFLSVVVVPLTWSNTMVLTLVLAGIGVLYLFVALWLERAWLVFPSLIAANLMVFTINNMFFNSYNTPFFTSMIIAYFSLGVAMVLGGLGLRRNDQERWTWPLLIVGSFNLLVTYFAGFIIGGWLVVGLSTALSALLLNFAWLERETFKEMKIPSLFTYLSIGILFIAHFYLLNEILTTSLIDIWPGYTAFLCALFFSLAQLVDKEPLRDIYSIPLRRSGTWLIIIPIIGSFASLNPLLVAITFCITGIILTVDAAIRRILNLAYVGIGAFIVMIWAILIEVGIDEPKVFIIPLGIALLAMGWVERNRGGGIKYRIPTMLGLLILMGSAFIQSLPRGNYLYAFLLLGECILAIYWGIRTRSRGFVQVGAAALIANTVVQLGPGFLDLDRWIQIGVTGVILVGGGMVGLIKREELLTTRQKLTEEWRKWES